jgi:hypothetical protein
VHADSSYLTTIASIAAKTLDALLFILAVGPQSGRG